MNYNELNEYVKNVNLHFNATYVIAHIDEVNNIVKLYNYINDDVRYCTYIENIGWCWCNAQKQTLFAFE